MSDNEDDNGGQTHLPWNEGLPTKPDIDALLKAFPPETIAPGRWRVTDDEIRTLIGMCEGNRFRTVTVAWRKRLLNDHRVIVFRQDNTGFFCPTPDEVFGRTHPTLEQAGRKLGRHLKRVVSVRPENDIQTITQEHQGKLLYATRRDLKKARMNSLPSTEAPEPVRISPPDNSRKNGPQSG